MGNQVTCELLQLLCRSVGCHDELNSGKEREQESQECLDRCATTEIDCGLQYCVDPTSKKFGDEGPLWLVN